MWKTHEFIAVYQILVVVNASGSVLATKSNRTAILRLTDPLHVLFDQHRELLIPPMHGSQGLDQGVLLILQHLPAKHDEQMNTSNKKKS